MTQKRKQYLAVLAGVLLTAGFWIYSLYGHKPIQRLLRPEQGTGSQETNLEVRIGEKTYSMELLLQEQKLSEEQVKKKMNQAKARLEEIFLNRNPDLQHIRGNVSMPSEEPETGISLQWYASSWEYLTVVSGEIELILEDGSFLVKTGSSLYFASDRKHIYRNIGETKAVLNMIITTQH